MKRIYSVAIAETLCACILIAGCSKLPRQEITAAKAAIESAQAARAPVFAAEQFKAAQEALTTVLADIKAQDAKSVFARNYEKDQKLLAAAAAAFEASKAAGAANKAKIEQDTKELLAMAKASVAEAGKIVKPLMKKKNRDAAALKTKLDAVAAALPADPASITDDALLATRDAIKNTMASVDSVKTALAQLGTAKKTTPKMTPKKKGKK
jgi:hypothetical protein